MVAIGSGRVKRAVGVGAVVGALLVGGAEGSLLARAAATRSERSVELAESCCAMLSFQLGPKVVYPSDPLYKSQSTTYWSLQESSIQPTCRLSPTRPSDVSLALLTISRYDCQFAIRGGGHMAWAGAANIQDGVTIDMGAMREVEVDDKGETVRVGTGATWGEVYQVLDEMGLAVSGGRVEGVGVAGLVIGGGLSFFSPRFGFVCDSVVNFEIVLPNGTLTNANSTANPNLYRALKGGSTNFGILTSVTFRTFQQGPIWGGLIITPMSSSTEQFQALEEFVDTSASDPYASVLNIYLYSQGASLALNSLVYGKPTEYPNVLKGLAGVGPQVMNTMRVTNVGDLATELAAGTPNGMRQLFGTATFGNNATLFASILNTTQSIFTPLRSIPGIQYTIVFQPITTTITEKGALTGGNVLGLDPSMGNLLWLDIDIQWANASDDALIASLARTAVSRASDLAREMGLLNPFVYLNYAFQEQDPIATYGPENVEFLREVSRQVDPERVFQRLARGGFKLWRDEVECEDE